MRKFFEKCFLAKTQDEDMTTAIVKALVEELERERVEQMWSKLNRKTFQVIMKNCSLVVVYLNFPKKSLRTARTALLAV